MRSMFSKDFWHPDNLRTTWEYKTIAFLLRMFVASIVIIYLVLTAPTVWSWMQVSYARSLPATHFPQLLDKAIKTNNFEWAYLWLNARPQQEATQHAKTLEQKVAQVPSMFIYNLARTSKNSGDIQDQRFWLTYTQYRMRYDLIRCGQEGLVEKYNQVQELAKLLNKQEDPMKEIHQDPARMADMLQKVLDYDAKHPASNPPDFTCNTLHRTIRGEAHQIPQEVWATIRHTLRLETEQAIRAMRKSNHTPAPQQPEVP